jgi:hypothetical protein
MRRESAVSSRSSVSASMLSWTVSASSGPSHPGRPGRKPSHPAHFGQVRRPVMPHRARTSHTRSGQRRPRRRSVGPTHISPDGDLRAVVPHRVDDRHSSDDITLSDGEPWQNVHSPADLYWNETSGPVRWMRAERYLRSPGTAPPWRSGSPTSASTSASRCCWRADPRPGSDRSGRGPPGRAGASRVGLAGRRGPRRRPAWARRASAAGRADRSPTRNVTFRRPG